MMPDPVPTSDVFLKIFEDRRQVATFEITRPTEIGRRQANEPAPYHRISLDAIDRIIVAELAETAVSRKHLRFEPRPDGNIELFNEGSKNSVALMGGIRIGPGENRLLELPIACEVGNKVVRVYLSPREALNLQSLQEATCLPGQSTRGSLATMGIVKSFAGGEIAKVEESDLLAWLQSSMDVFQSAAASVEFLPKAAQAAVQLVGLDTAAVLLYQEGEWTTASVKAQTGDAVRENWQASQTMLRRVLEERRTFFHVPIHNAAVAASLLHVQSLVAAPFLDRNGRVLGVLYGERRTASQAGERQPIRELDAKLVELLAFGVSSGLARIEQERQLIAERVRFEQFFTPELARMLEIRGDDMLAARDAQITVLFCDIKGFSRISASCGAELAIEWVCDVLSELSDCVAEHQGVLVDYSGDALEALWGAPLPAPDHASLACRAALKMRERLPAINERWQTRLGELTDVAIGIHSGTAQVGNIGSRRKYKYGALGTTVNLASRIQGSTKFIGRSLLVSGSTVELVNGPANSLADPEFAFRRLCTIRTVNIDQPVIIHELQASPSAAWLALKVQYEAALSNFETQQFSAAEEALNHLVHSYPDDEPSRQLADRLAQTRTQSPPFDSVWTLGGK